MTRCATCRHWIWPWQRFGFETTEQGRRVAWHVKCGRPL